MSSHTITLPLAPSGADFGDAVVQVQTGSIFLHGPGGDCILVLSCHLESLAEAVRVAIAVRDAD